MGHSKDPKLRATLDEGLHYVPASIKVPTKQTLFYDDKHASGITEQQMQQWKAKNGKVYLDTFHTSKKAIPVNRHRIPQVLAANEIAVGSGAVRKISPVDNKDYIWDLDGRRHKKPKRKTQPVITSNVSLNRVDLPHIKPGQTGILSPSGVGIHSQPKMPSTNPSFGSYPGTTKFVAPNDPRARKKQPPRKNNIN